MNKLFRTIVMLMIISTSISACQTEKSKINQSKPVEQSSSQDEKLNPETKPETISSKESSEQKKDEPSIPKEDSAGGNAVNTWQKKYGSSNQDTIRSILQAEDGGYYLLGVANMAWEAEQGADMLLIRIDTAGEVIWEKIYPGEPFKTGSSLIFTKDGNILIAGQIAVDYETRMDIHLIKIDRDGNTLSSKTIGGPMDDWVNNIQQTKDGGYVLFGNIVDPDDFVTDPGAAGYGGFENRSSIQVFRLDESFEVVWQQVFDSGENVMSIGGAQDPGGEFYIVSSIMAFPDPFDAIHVLKIDQAGNQVWSYIFDDQRTNPRDFLVTSSGNLLIGGMYSETGDPREGDADIFLVEFDPEGNQLWSTVAGTPGVVDMLSGLLETKDGGYLILEDRTPDLYNSISELTLLKLNQNLEFEWENVLDRGAHYMICDLLKDKNGFLAATSFVTRTPESVGIMLIKTDLKGTFSD